MPEIIRLDPHYRRGNRNPERLSRWTQSHWANEEPSPQGLVLTVMSLDNAQLIPEMLKRCGFRDKKKKLAVRFCLVLLEGYQSLEIWPGLDCRVDTAFAPQLGSTPAHRHCTVAAVLGPVSHPLPETSGPPEAGCLPSPQCPWCHAFPCLTWLPLEPNSFTSSWCWQVFIHWSNRLKVIWILKILFIINICLWRLLLIRDFKIQNWPLKAWNYIQLMFDLL